MAPSRKRRSDQIDLDSSDASPHPTTRRRRSSSSPSSASAADDGDDDNQPSNTLQSLIKKLVRLALSLSYSRTPLRRVDISAKILSDSLRSRQFKPVFEGAQQTLRDVFGMELVELPSRERTTLKERRAQTTQTTTKAGGVGASASSKAWVVVSLLPAAYKESAAIVGPGLAGAVGSEAVYTALYSLVVALVYLNSGVLAEAKLERYLKRLNSDTFTPLGSLDKVLARIVRDGYLDKRRDTSSGEDVVEYCVGPRGKIEIGVSGVQGLARIVYGDLDEPAAQELEDRLARSLGLSKRTAAEAVGDDDDDQDNGNRGAEGGYAATDGEVDNADREPPPPQQLQRRRERPRRAAVARNGSDND